MAIKGAQHGIRGRGSYNVQVKLEGQILKFNYITQHVNILLAAAAINAQRKFATKYRDKVIENIKNGGINLYLSYLMLNLLKPRPLRSITLCLRNF